MRFGRRGGPRPGPADGFVGAQRRRGVRVGRRPGEGAAGGPGASDASDAAGRAGRPPDAPASRRPQATVGLQSPQLSAPRAAIVHR